MNIKNHDSGRKWKEISRPHKSKVEVLIVIFSASMGGDFIYS
jgi:hypothetical protein